MMERYGLTVHDEAVSLVQRPKNLALGSGRSNNSLHCIYIFCTIPFHWGDNIRHILYLPYSRTESITENAFKLSVKLDGNRFLSP